MSTEGLISEDEATATVLSKTHCEHESKKHCTGPRLWRPPLGPAGPGDHHNAYPVQHHVTVHQVQGPPQVHVSRLYPEILALIFERLCVRDKGRAARTCRSWREAAYRRSVWRGATATLHLKRTSGDQILFKSLARRGIRRVQVLSLRRSLREVVRGVPELEALDLSGCYSVTDACLGHAFSLDLPKLRELDLSLCKQVSDASLGRIAEHLKNLEILGLGGCSNVTDTGLLLVAWGLKKLRKLDLRSCWHVGDRGIGHLTGSEPGSNGGCQQLEHLGLQDCQRLTDEALRLVAVGLPSLRYINLSFCASVTDAGLRHLAKAGALRELNLHSCDGISDAGVAHLAEGGSRVRSLDVSFCDKVGDRALAHIAQGLFGLRSLSLSACQISDEGLDRVAKALPELETLNIGQCARITDRGLKRVADSLIRLKNIDLYGCPRITKAGLERITKLPNLNNLNLGLWHER